MDELESSAITPDQEATRRISGMMREIMLGMTPIVVERLRGLSTEDLILRAQQAAYRMGEGGGGDNLYGSGVGKRSSKSKELECMAEMLSAAAIVHSRLPGKKQSPIRVFGQTWSLEDIGVFGDDDSGFAAPPRSEARTQESYCLELLDGAN